MFDVASFFIEHVISKKLPFTVFILNGKKVAGSVVNVFDLRLLKNMISHNVLLLHLENS